MYPEVTSVYVPVTTPDYKKWALMFSLLVHVGVLGLVVYFHHEPAPKPMETSIVTPEQLSQIEAQIRANQQNNAAISGDMAGGAQSTMSEIMQKVTDTIHPSQSTSQQDSQTAQMMNDIAAKEAQWRKEQAQFAEKIDQEIATENQQRIEQLNAEQAEQQAQLNNYKDAENNQDAIRQELIEAANKSQEALKAQRENTKTNVTNRNIDLKFDGEGTSAGSGSNRAAVGGNGETSKGASSGGNAAGYISQIKGIIDSHWSPPANSQGKSLTASFNISENGVISNIRVNGGDDAFKRSLEQALQASSPLPPPPENIYAKVDYNNFTFTAN